MVCISFPSVFFLSFYYISFLLQVWWKVMKLWSSMELLSVIWIWCLLSQFCKKNWLYAWCSGHPDQVNKSEVWKIEDFVFEFIYTKLKYLASKIWNQNSTLLQMDWAGNEARFRGQKKPAHRIGYFWGWKMLGFRWLVVVWLGVHTWTNTKRGQKRNH